LTDLLAGNGFYGLISAGDFDLSAGAADGCSGFENVNYLAFVVGGKQSSWLPLAIARESGFFWKADWGEGTAGAQAFVVGDGGCWVDIRSDRAVWTASRTAARAESSRGTRTSTLSAW